MGSAHLDDDVVGNLWLTVVDSAQARVLVDKDIHLSTVLVPETGKELCQLLPQADLQRHSNAWGSGYLLRKPTPCVTTLTGIRLQI